MIKRGKEVSTVNRETVKTIVRVVAVIIGILAVVTVLWIAVWFFAGTMIFVHLLGSDQSMEEGKYSVLRLSAESNVRGDEEDYVLRKGNQIIFYSFETGETTEYCLEATQAAGRSGIIAGTMLYSVMPDGTVRRFDLEKQADEELLSGEDICRMYGSADLPDEFDVTITRAEKNWLLTIDGSDEEAYYYICPADGELKTDCVEVNTLFPEEDRTGGEQTALYRGMRVRRYYDTEKEGYHIIELGEKAGRPEIFNAARKDMGTVRAGGKLVSFGYQRGDRSYCVEGDLEEHEIGCLDASAFAFAVVKPNNIMTEDGEIIGLVHAVKNFRCDSWDPPQDELRYDVLFKLDPKTGKNSILYSPWNNQTRIIGYQDGVIYLLKDFKIYSRVMENEEENQIVELPEDTYYEFDWQGDYIIVIDRDGIYGAYDVAEKYDTDNSNGETDWAVGDQRRCGRDRGKL